MIGGMLLHSPWLIIAGFFIMIGAQIEDQGVFFQSVVDTVRMHEVMLTDFATLSPSDTLADALGRCVHSLQEDFPVVRGPQLVGIVSRQRIVDALRADGNGYVQSVMSRAFQVARPEDTLGTTIRRITAGAAFPDPRYRQRVVGIVSVQNLRDSSDPSGGAGRRSGSGGCSQLAAFSSYQAWHRFETLIMRSDTRAIPALAPGLSSSPSSATSATSPWRWMC
jgi:CBS domain-containing protein